MVSSGDTLLVSLLPPSLRHSAPHQRVHETFRRYAHGFTLNWDAPTFTLPAQKTWLLYEMWCVFAVADVLRGLGFVARTGDWFATAPFGLSCRLATDKASRLTMENQATRQTVTLTYNRFFPRAGSSDDTPTAGWHSRGRALRPDITLQCGGASGSLLVLDAKFKTYMTPGWEGADIQQMHSYRDAIAHGNRRNIVGAAWLLYAGGHASDSRRPVIAYPAATSDAPLGNGEVGAICLRPSVEREPCDALFNLIRVFLSNSGSGKH